MESTKSNLQENQKKSYQCKEGQKSSQKIDDCASCIFCFVHTSLCYDLLVKFFLRLCCVLIHWLRDLCNSGINPCLYAWKLPWFKRAFYKFLHFKARS